MAYTDIDKPEDYFTAFLRVGVYAGSGTTDFNIGFQPDLVWDKNRTSTSNHDLIDSVRGGGINLNTNDTSADASGANVTSFLSNGFQITNFNDWGSGNNIVDWCWKAGGTASSNTDGSITSNISASTTSGFSIVSYTGTGSASTIGHGLNSVPKVIIIKDRSNARNWQSYHESLGNQAYLRLNTTGSASTGASIWNNTSPTSSVFSIGTSAFDAVNASGDDYIAYCFAEKKGFSKMGSYVATGSSDGNFIYTGFTPAFILTKCSSTDNGSTFWCIFDNKREGYNGANDRIFPNVSNAESNDSPSEMDILSNGFKIRGVSSSHNISGQTFIYMAFAENPFTTSTGIPTTAR